MNYLTSALIVLVILIVGFLAWPRQAPVSAAQVLTELNHYREANGYPAFIENPVLTLGAQGAAAAGTQDIKNIDLNQVRLLRYDSIVLLSITSIHDLQTVVENNTQVQSKLFDAGLNTIGIGVSATNKGERIYIALAQL